MLMLTKHFTPNDVARLILKGTSDFHGITLVHNIRPSFFLCLTKILSNCTHLIPPKNRNKKKLVFAKTGLLSNLNGVLLLLGAGTRIKPVQTRREWPTKRVVGAMFPQRKAQRKNESQMGKFSLCCGGGAAPPTIQKSWKTKQKQKLVEDILSLFCLSF